MKRMSSENKLKMTGANERESGMRDMKRGDRLEIPETRSCGGVRAGCPLWSLGPRLRPGWDTQDFESIRVTLTVQVYQMRQTFMQLDSTQFQLRMT